jgi:hypothetical protein
MLAKFFRVLISGESISESFTQVIGTADCERDYPGGQVKFSHNGKWLFFIDYVDNIADVYEFNRKTGELNNYRTFGRQPRTL